MIFNKLTANALLVVVVSHHLPSILNLYNQKSLSH